MDIPTYDVTLLRRPEYLNRAENHKGQNTYTVTFFTCFMLPATAVFLYLIMARKVRALPHERTFGWLNDVYRWGVRWPGGRAYILFSFLPVRSKPTLGRGAERAG